MKKVYFVLFLLSNILIGFSQDLSMSVVRQLGCGEYMVKYRSSASWSYCDCKTGRRLQGNRASGGNATQTLITNVVAVKTSVRGATASLIRNVIVRSSSNSLNSESTDNVFDYYKVYPNPITSSFNIESNSGIEVAKVEIYNYLGKKVFDDQVNDQKVENINLKNGIYTLKIYDVNNTELNNQIISVNNY